MPSVSPHESEFRKDAAKLFLSITGCPEANTTTTATITTSSDVSLDPDIFQRLYKIVTVEPQSWEKAWHEHVTPWDKGFPQPALQNLLESELGKMSFPKQGRALVPGCGGGYDAVLIASHLGYSTTALDISPTALEKAKTYATDYPQEVQDKLSFMGEDFFGLDEIPYEIVYDYTFFVAIPPTRRSEWGTQMSKLVKPGNHLITLMWPFVEPREWGPPFHVTFDHYKEALGDINWEVIQDEIIEEPDKRKRLVIWKRL